MARPHFQQRAAIKSLELTALHLGHLALGELDVAAKYGAASLAWAELGKAVAEHVSRSPHMQWLYDQIPTDGPATDVPLWLSAMPGQAV